MRARRLAFHGAVLLCAVACAPGVQPRSTDPSDATTAEDGSTRRRGSRSSNVLPSSEIRASLHSDVFEMIQALRPNWLTPRGQASFSVTQLEVFLDGVEMQGLTMLRTLTPSQIERAEYLSASEATMRFGTQQGAGAILLISRRGNR